VTIPAPELIAKLREIQDRHNAAVKSHDIVNALHANIAFHATLFEACGNPYLAEAISQLALKSHGIRFYSLMRVEFLERARSDHEAIIDALIKGDRTALAHSVQASYPALSPSIY
jgi:DNA-binding GntR family transcriptional regulator